MNRKNREAGYILTEVLVTSVVIIMGATVLLMMWGAVLSADQVSEGMDRDIRMMMQLPEKLRVCFEKEQPQNAEEARKIVQQILSEEKSVVFKVQEDDDCFEVLIEGVGNQIYVVEISKGF